MNYYEITNPYYALIKAQNENEATKLYIEFVAGDDSEFDDLLKEVELVPEYYASARYARTVGEDKESIPLNEILEDLRNDDSQVLIIDSALI